LSKNTEISKILFTENLYSLANAGKGTIAYSLPLKSMNMKNIPPWKAMLAMALLFALAAEFFQHIAKRSPEEQVAYAQEKVYEREGRMHEALESIAAFSTDSQYHEYFIHSGLNPRFSFFVFENGILKQWSNNEIALPENTGSRKITDMSVLHLPNGIFEAFEKDTGYKKIIGLILLRKNYSYENKYLENHFSRALELGNDFVLARGNGTYQLKSSAGNVLLALDITDTIPDKLPFKTPAWLYLCAFIAFFTSIFLFFRNRTTSFTPVLAIGSFFILLRYLMIRFHLPGELYYNDFFSPKVYGSSFYFNSLGDFFLNAIALICFSGIIYSFCRNRAFSFRKSISAYVFIPLTLFFLCLLFYGIHNLISDLVLNSKIPFDTSITNLDENSVVGALIILLLLWSFYLLAASVFIPSMKIFFRAAKASGFSSFRSGLAALIVISIYASFLIDAGLKEKRMENQKLFAQRLDSRRDPLAEYLFGDLQKHMANDTVVRRLASEKDGGGDLSHYLQQNYFTGYFGKFDASISVFREDSFASGSQSQLNDFRNRFTEGKPTSSATLVLLPDESGKLKYLSVFTIADSTGGSSVIAIMLVARTTQMAEGFPELLVSNTVIRNNDESAYSYARYSEGSLIFAGGNFPYAFHSTLFEKTTGDFSSLVFDDYEHIIYRPSATSLVVVSRPAAGFLDTLSLFSYVLLFFLSVFLVTHLFLFLTGYRRGFQLSLKQRIRSSIISLVVISFILIAVGTSVYIVRKYDADKNKTILSRLNAMWFAITDHFNVQEGLSLEQKNEWTSGLNDIISNFNFDFNLYDENGNLFFSSQPKLFEKGILSDRINPEAFYEMRLYGKTQFVHTESIGTLNYASAYAPFTGPNGNIAGYLNLPYFEKQNELNKEISGFLSALINIYLLLLVASLLLALFITSRITKPLLLIQERLRQVKLGSRNEIIDWKRNDEIGQLVQQYNSMVDALAESAEKLTRSERESAWREMAQQVAHEIKNPLTPMKLSVQHLQRAWKDKSGNLDELFQRISRTLIEQIDTLSTIASAFSDFARMPKAKNELVRLNEVVVSSINIFNDTSGIEIIFNDNGQDHSVFADREQLIRAFSNIIKNAIQSIPNQRKGLITISITSVNHEHVISFADNGTGIPSALVPKIFTPSFTTKSSGMGLGLAIVKSTIDAALGSIWFETKEGEGTVFYVALPKGQQPAP
jgi:two-component system nitrogen regulation sensor histidine kinase NtrY